MENRISIIVPCYNACNYVSETINSVINQDYKNWELILVNDGSTDTTLDILNSYALKDKRISVYDIPNGGVSKARNLGLDIAHGDWIMFLDSDDWFETNALSTVKNYIDKNPMCDVFGFNHYYNSEVKQWKRGQFQPTVIKRKNSEIEWFKLDTMFPYYDAVKNKITVGAIRGVWGKVFRKRLIALKHLRFIENLKISEDAIFCLDVFTHAHEVILFDDYLIHYRVHSSSAMNGYSKDVADINDFALKQYWKRKDNFKDKDDFDICYMGMVAECLFRTFKLYLLHPKNNSSFSNKLTFLKKYIESEKINYALKNITLKYLPIGKRELIFCAKHNMLISMFLIAYLSVSILKYKK